MSITPALRQMRIIAIPLTRPTLRPPIKSGKPNVLTYYQFQITSPPPKPKKPETSTQGSGAGAGAGGTWWSRVEREGGVAKWVSAKAADTWAGFGKAKGGWKLKTYEMGEKLVDRMDFEELALKGIDPALGPKVGGSGEGSKSLKHTIPLMYPPSINSGSTTLEELRRVLAYRTPRHRKGFFAWMFIAPLTAPFMIIPIIPNLPFFFCVWRSWSHYKAYRASQYLQSLLDNDAIVPEASESLDIVYKDYAPSSTSSTTSASSSPPSSADEKTPLHKEPPPPPPPPSSPPPPNAAQHIVLLTRDAVPALLSLFGLKPTAGADLQRAVEQARVRVKSGRGTL